MQKGCNPPVTTARWVKFRSVYCHEELSVEVAARNQMFLVDKDGYVSINGSEEITPNLARLLIEVLTCGLECMQEAQKEFDNENF